MNIHYFYVLPVLLVIGSIAWLYASRRENVNIVDSLWSLFFLVASVIYLAMSPQLLLSNILLTGLVAVWAIRLSLHLSLRNANKTEDRRYAAMRAANPRFNKQSLFTVFGLQAFLAWLISVPLAAAIFEPTVINSWHYAALVLFMAGFIFESVADWQLARFKRAPENKGQLLNAGLWRYSRHPNYFGEALIWWAFFLYAVGSDALWTIFAPVLMTFLLLKVSGVTLLEKDISDRRPAYRDYIETTSVFIPWWPKQPTQGQLLNGKRS